MSPFRPAKGCPGAAAIAPDRARSPPDGRVGSPARAVEARSAYGAAPWAADHGAWAVCCQTPAAGAAPIRRGRPGYRDALDRDKDDVACDKWCRGEASWARIFRSDRLGALASGGGGPAESGLRDGTRGRSWGQVRRRMPVRVPVRMRLRGRARVQRCPCSRASPCSGRSST
ncbi:excalibur calcium-binding domain-containing protein [Streptomyces sp. NPDC054787]